MRRRGTFCLIAVAVCCAVGLGQNTAHGQFWKRLIPVKRVEADSSANYLLEQEDGPWLIMAATFSGGEDAEEQARQLAFELRRDFNLPSYVHEMTFDFSDEDVGRGIDKYGAPIKMRYRRGATIQEWAVLVGDFAQIDDPKGQDLLERVKHMTPKALAPDADGQTSQSLASVRRLQEAIVTRLRQDQALGPMRTAFMTRNPLLPKEYFVPQGVDSFVEKMNSGSEFNLLECPGKYTVKVATFEGSRSIQGASTMMSTKRRKNDSDPLAEAAENAHLLAEEMRRLGWEAYEFHDRQESYVAVGSFDKITTTGADGSAVPTNEVAQIIQTFGAAYNTPADPLQQARVPVGVKIKAENVQHEFSQRFSSEYGQAATGLNPKFARVPPKSPKARVITFDINPQVMETPRRSVSGSFAWR